MYQLADTSRVDYASPSYLQRLLARPHLLKVKEITHNNELRLIFQSDGIGAFAPYDPRATVFQDQEFLLPQKSLANVYKNKGTEFEVRSIFERAGMTGYNPAANLIVKQMTGVKYTPNPYQPGGKRKTIKRKGKKKLKSRKYGRHS